MATATERIPVEGVLAVEGEPMGDGRMFAHGSLSWDGTLPFAIVWDRQEGDHSAMTVGAITDIERRDAGVIWGTGYLSASDDPETQAAVTRVSELLDEGAVGVSLRWDNHTTEIRVPREMIEPAEGDLLPQPITFEEDEDGRVVVQRSSAADIMEVTTAGRARHLAVVDTAASHLTRIQRATGAIAASALVGEWEGRDAWFQDPKFGDPDKDSRLRYDPDYQIWSCPPTLTADGRVFGHIAPMGICLRGRPDKCVTPPDADLEGFMRAHAPAAGGLRTGVICVGGGHCATGVGAAEATRHYDNTGRAVADIRVGKDRYGIWFAGMARPGASEADLYAFAASDVSGHWEYTKRGRMTLTGLPAVNVGGFAKGWMTYDEYRSGVAASAEVGIAAGASIMDCRDETDELFPDTDLGAQLAQLTNAVSRIEQALGPMYASYLLAQDA
jgi:hypothetical protein